MKSFRLKYLSVLSAIVGIMTFVFSVNAEEWKLHPSFDRTPLRIIDTPEDTYFLVHQQIYDKSKVGYDFPSLTLFRYNKNATDKGITPLVHDVQLSSADIRTVDYSPKGEYLIIVYNDGGVDLIDKDRHLTHIDKLKRYTIPGMAKVTSVSFEPSTGDAWIGTDAGYMHVDAVSFTVQEVKVFDRGIERICRFGDKLVALSENAAWQSNGINPLTFNEFKKISSVGSPSIMLPLGENEFAYVYGAPGSNSPINRVLKLARFDNSSWKVADLGQDSFYSLSNNGALVNRYESNFIPNKDGYLIYSTSKAWQLYAPKDGESTKLVSISLDSNPISLGSWDFSNFWSYRDRGTFVPRHAEFTMDSNATSASATWTDMQDPIRPDAPAAYICTYMDYSPKYGMLVVNHGIEWTMSGTNIVNPSLLSGLTDKWSIYSQAYFSPYILDTNDALRNVYEENINRFPIPDPHGVLVDTDNPDWVISGSMFGGLMFQDLSDVKKNVIKFAAENDLFSDFTGVYSVMPQKSWGTLCCFSPPAIDNNGTLWSIYSNTYTSNPLQLTYITSEDRKKLMCSNISEEEAEQYLKKIEFSYPKNVFWCCKVLPLHHKDNDTKIILCPNSYTTSLLLFDHKGTLEDFSDDVCIEILGLESLASERQEFIQILNILEDPQTGDIFLVSSNNIMILNLKSDISQGYVKENINDSEKFRILENIPINNLSFDEDGNLWIATNNEGIICLSKEDRSIISRYNTKNSKIPSDCVYALKWNSDYHSLMISTKFGLAEVYPEIITNNSIKSRASVFPCNVLNNYNGNVEIRNIAPFQNVSIIDKNGRIVRVLSNEDSRILDWDLKDSDGRRLPKGIYYINVENGQSLELTIMSEDK